MSDVTVTVKVSWRLARVEINTPGTVAGSVSGYGETLLQDEEGKYSGAMPGATINRSINEVMNDTIDAGGTTVSFVDVMEVLRLFFEKWRVEDANLQIPQRVPPVDNLTPVQAPFQNPPPQYDELPPPVRGDEPVVPPTPPEVIPVPPPPERT